MRDGLLFLILTTELSQSGIKDQVMFLVLKGWLQCGMRGRG